MKTGQSLVILLVFVAVAVTITTTTASLAAINSTTSSHLELGQITLNMAESGLENALIRLLRDPSYGGETLTVDAGTATITISGTNPYIITSVGDYAGFTRQVQVTVLFTAGRMAISSWLESY